MIDDVKRYVTRDVTVLPVHVIWGQDQKCFVTLSVPTLTTSLGERVSA